MEPGQQYSHNLELCALATWSGEESQYCLEEHSHIHQQLISFSDWDLGVCLHYECRRKQIRKSAYFDQWIDLRSLYQQFYDRRPSGLSGSLEDLGIPFTGREHCGKPPLWHGQLHQCYTLPAFLGCLYF